MSMFEIGDRVMVMAGSLTGERGNIIKRVKKNVLWLNSHSDDPIHNELKSDDQSYFCLVKLDSQFRNWYYQESDLKLIVGVKKYNDWVNSVKNNHPEDPFGEETWDDPEPFGNDIDPFGDR